jgi:RNA-directed DNA polymerase
LEVRRGRMTKTSISLQELRRKIYKKAKTEKHWRFWKKLKGFGWKLWSREDIYKKWGLYNDYRIRYIYPKATPSR